MCRHLLVYNLEEIICVVSVNGILTGPNQLEIRVEIGALFLALVGQVSVRRDWL